MGCSNFYFIFRAATTVSATRDAATSILQHDAGPEAVELANKSGEAAGNVGKAAGDLTLVRWFFAHPNPWRTDPELI